MNITNAINDLPWHDERKWGYRPESRINKIIVHQSLSTGSVEAINNYHIHPNHISRLGLPHLAYHYAIRRDGEVLQANELTAILAHTRGQNTSGIGIMLCGHFDGINYYKGTQVPTGEQFAGLDGLLTYLLTTLSLPFSSIHSHAMHGKLACPGLKVEEFLNAYRRNRL